MDISFEKVGITAFVIAEWRALETESPTPLFLDHIANIFLSKETKEIAEKIAQASASTQFLVRYRTRFFDDLFIQRMNNGVRQFCILGSGLDTRSIRLATDDVRFFEVEQEQVISFKRQKLQEQGYSLENNAYVDADYTKVEFMEALIAQGFDPNLKTLFLWEGNVFYLLYEHIISVINTINQYVPSFELAFDYLSDKLIKRSTGYDQSEHLLEGFASLGAPWQTGIGDIQRIANETNTAVQRNFLIADYVNQRNDTFAVDRDLLDDYYICLLTNK